MHRVSFQGISMMSNILNSIVNAIFNGSFVLLICLSVVKPFKIDIHPTKYNLLIKSVSYTLLLGSVIYIGSLLRSIYGNILVGSKDERYSMISYWFGRYWFAPWLFFFMYALLPQILWVRKFNQSLVNLTIVVLIWGALSLFIAFTSTHGYWQVEWKALIMQTLIYLFLLSVMYLILSRRKRQSKPASTNL